MGQSKLPVKCKNCAIDGPSKNIATRKKWGRIQCSLYVFWLCPSCHAKYKKLEEKEKEKEKEKLRKERKEAGLPEPSVFFSIASLFASSSKIRSH